MRFTLLAVALMVFSSCASQSPIKSEYLVGDAVFPASRIERALSQDAVVYKPRVSKQKQNPTELGNVTKISKAATQVSVRMILMTKPLVASRVNEIMNERADREIWREARLKNEIRNALSTDLIRYVSGKQCFDTFLTMSGAKQKSRAAVPAELDPRKWQGRLSQGNHVYGLDVVEGPRCSGQVGRAFSISPFRVRFGSGKDVQCRLIACAPASINLREPFVVEYRPRFEQNLFPVVISWPGTRDVQQSAKMQVSSR